MYIHTHFDNLLAIGLYHCLKCKSLYIKGILHPKRKILSSFTHPQVVANLYEFLSPAKHKGRYFVELWHH